MGAPKIVLEHYRSPQNKRAMPNAAVSYSVAGREEGTALTLFVLVDGDRIVDASFTNTGDRQEDPASSMLTLLLKGKTLEDAARVDQLAIATALESAHAPALAVLAFEAWRGALARLRGEPTPDATDGPLVCKCLKVPEGRIRRVIRERRLATVDDVSLWTRACTNCRSCRPDIEKMLGER